MNTKKCKNHKIKQMTSPEQSIIIYFCEVCEKILKIKHKEK